MKPRVTVAAIRQGIRDMILKLDGNPPYTTLIPADINLDTGDPAHFYQAYAEAMNTQQDPDYPKVVVVLDGGEEADNPSHQVRETCSVDLIFIFKQVPIDPYNVRVRDQVEAFVDDFKRLRYNYRTLNDLIENLQVLDWTTDSGFDFPEGVVWYRLQAQYRNTM